MWGKKTSCKTFSEAHGTERDSCRGGGIANGGAIPEWRGGKPGLGGVDVKVEEKRRKVRDKKSFREYQTHSGVR